MSAFNAASVSTLDYDFTTSVGANGLPLEGKGVVPEPSSDQLLEFVEGMQAVGERDQAIVAAGGKIDSKASLQELKVLTANFCNGSPTLEQIEALPVRLFQAFSQWLQGEFAGPKA
jgi:hypothetical protein